MVYPLLVKLVFRKYFNFPNFHVCEKLSSQLHSIKTLRLLKILTQNLSCTECLHLLIILLTCEEYIRKFVKMNFQLSSAFSIRTKVWQNSIDLTQDYTK